MSPRLRIGLSALVTLNVVFVMAALWFNIGLDALPDAMDDGHGHLLGFNRPFTWGHMLLAFTRGSLEFSKLTILDGVFLSMHAVGLLVIASFLRYLRGHGLLVFAFYRVGLAFAVLWLMRP